MGKNSVWIIERRLTPKSEWLPYIRTAYYQSAEEADALHPGLMEDSKYFRASEYARVESQEAK